MYGSECGAFSHGAAQSGRSHDSRQPNEMVKTVLLGGLFLIANIYLVTWDGFVLQERQMP